MLSIRAPPNTVGVTTLEMAEATRAAFGADEEAVQITFDEKIRQRDDTI
jgi:hypothetical protein